MKEHEIVFAIVTNNCWGSGLYQEHRLIYNTPFIGLFVYPSHYIKLLSDLRYHLRQKIEFSDQASCRRFHASSIFENHPVGKLGNEIEIHFLHYKNSADAETKWVARSSRLPDCDDDLYIKICDRDDFTQEHLDAFRRLPFKNKVAYVKKGQFSTDDCPWIIEIETSRATMPSGVTLWRKTKNRADFRIGPWVGLG